MPIVDFAQARTACGPGGQYHQLMKLGFEESKTPYSSGSQSARSWTDLTTIIEQDGDIFVVLWSPETAEHDPDYRELGTFPTREG
jgi:hypothetical protein